MAVADESLARRLGVTEAVVMALRAERLKEGEHWTREAGGRVSYLPAGVDALHAILELQKKDGPEMEPERVLLSVTRLHPNKAFVSVRTPAGKLQDLRVRPHHNMRPGLQLRCEIREGKWVCIQPGIAPA